MARCPKKPTRLPPGTARSAAPPASPRFHPWGTSRPDPTRSRPNARQRRGQRRSRSRNSENSDWISLPGTGRTAELRTVIPGLNKCASLKLRTELVCLSSLVGGVRSGRDSTTEEEEGMERTNADRGLGPGFLALRAKRLRYLSSPWSSVSLWFDSTMVRESR